MAAGILITSAGAAVAAPAAVTGDVNLRSGPGTGYAVVGTMPAGATVDVRDCNGAWCRVAWGSAVGFASRSYLNVGGPDYAAAPPPVVFGPAVVGFGWGGGWRGGWHRGWHGGHRGWHGGGHFGHHR